MLGRGSGEGMRWCWEGGGDGGGGNAGGGCRFVVEGEAWRA